MSVGLNGRTKFHTLEDVLRNLGGIPASRVRVDPAPGTATIRDLLRLWKAEGRMCELVDGTLVDKPMAAPESYIAGQIQTSINLYLMTHKLGFTLGEQGMLKLSKGLIRAPDVSFVSWEQLPQPKVPREPLFALYPDLAVEVYSKGNTRKEMARKRREYFRAGCRLVWIVYPRTETVDVYSDPEHFTTYSDADTLNGDDVLPGFRLPIRSFFGELAPLEPKPRKRR